MHQQADTPDRATGRLGGPMPSVRTLPTRSATDRAAIFITAFPTHHLHAKLNAPGVVAIFEKPIDPNAMADCIGRVLGVA
jgi:hypothetical protein